MEEKNKNSGYLSDEHLIMIGKLLDLAEKTEKDNHPSEYYKLRYVLSALAMERSASYLKGLGFAFTQNEENKEKSLRPVLIPTEKV